MKIGGDILVRKPGMKKQRILFKNGTEFSFATASSPEEKIGFYIWFELDEDEVTIKSDFADDEQIRESMVLYIESVDGQHLGLSLSLEQAQAIKDVLENYIKAFHSTRALLESKTIENQQAS